MNSFRQRTKFPAFRGGRARARLLLALLALPMVLGACKTKSQDLFPTARSSPSDSGSQVGAILQLIIDAEPLQEYFHVTNGVPLRPIAIVKNQVLPKAPALQKFGRPVTYVPSSDPPEDDLPALLFEVFTISDDGRTAQATFRYPVEGVVGEAKLERLEDRWVIRDFGVAEN